MKVWWSRTPLPGNFGDILTPWMMRRMGVEPEFSRPGPGVLMATGSIIRLAQPGCVIWGSGVIDSGDQLSVEMDVRTVRGPLTRTHLIAEGIPCPDTYGDPALLLPRFYEEPHEVEHSVGIVPHYLDYRAGRGEGFRINPICGEDGICGFIDAVRSCAKIESSSLHGLIVAQAYGIPYRYVDLGARLTGDGVKFRDFAASVHRDDLTEFGLGEIDLEPLWQACPFGPGRNGAST